MKYTIKSRSIAEPGCGKATGKESCAQVEIEHGKHPLFLCVSLSMTTPNWYMFDVHKDGAFFCDGTLDGTEDLDAAIAAIVEEVLKVTPRERGEFIRLPTIKLEWPKDGCDKPYTPARARERARDHVAYKWARSPGSHTCQWTAPLHAAYNAEFDKLTKENHEHAST